MTIKTAIKALVREDNVRFVEDITQVLAEKAIAKLDELKVNIGESYFGSVKNLPKA